MTTKERYKIVMERFAEAMPSPKTELNYDTPFHLLLAVILSAQCTDKRINQVTPELFKRFPFPADLAAVEPEDVYPYIRSVSYPNNKSKALVGAARTLVEKFSGEMPRDIDALLTLPGVGRKTANVILSVVFNQAAMAVDTHVFRVSERIGLTTKSRTPLETEKKLTANIPDTDIPRAHHWLILHGRYVCKARRPDCDACFLTDICRFHSNMKK